MSDANVWSFTGRVGKDPTWKEGGNYQLSTFSVANDIGWGDKKKTQWVRVKAWGKLGDRVNRFIRKGYKVFVTGEVQVETWTDKEGKTRSDLVVEARAVETMSQSRAQSSGGGDDPLGPLPDAHGTLPSDEDTPF